MKQVHRAFHKAEVAVQERLGFAERMSNVGASFIRPYMPEQHRAFFQSLSMLMLGLSDKHGWPCALPVFSDPGFISSPTNQELKVSALPSALEALDCVLAQGEKVATLGIDLSSRRRNRMNGLVSNRDTEGFSIAVEQSFGNCPKYIQTQALTVKAMHSKLKQEISSSLSGLDEQARWFISQAFSFYIASRTDEFNDQENTGLDISHRGGKLGFVKAQANTLLFPDFSGNRFYNTLGNIESDSRVALLFPDFQKSRALHVQGRAKIHWQHTALESFVGAERIIEVHVQKSTYLDLAATGELMEYSPALDKTGHWPDGN
ncbi:pyridoxamine 5'-phosphate oxidase family protein [Agaribacterium sp. ZY112]|uniref:pyridoxamine 5'-phosphate oxidase family protein n=1 Tax=Agaribacterium sp. ZY112 TaxID=3233574 RepID=UPI003525A4FF